MSDTIFFDGTDYFLYGAPLESRGDLPSFISSSSANLSGYRSVWAVVSQRLFLVSLSGCIPYDNRNAFDFVFPNADGPVLADWYSGELRLQQGRVVQQGDTDTLHEHETILTIEKGHIKKRRSFRRELNRTPVFDPVLFQFISAVEEFDSKLVEKFASARIQRIGDLIQVGELELISSIGLSLEAAIEVKEAMTCRGLILGTRLSGWSPPIVATPPN